MEVDAMTQRELAEYLETLAELIRAKATSAEEAAEILERKAQNLK